MAESAAATMPASAEVRTWVGAHLTELGGKRVGEVHGFFVDQESAEPAWLIARLGGRRRARLVAVPLRFCAGAPFGAWVVQEEERLASAPIVDPERPLLREHELTICAHFGAGEEVGRAAEVAGRAEGSVTSVPAP
jgi:hypothetical protein